MTHCSFGGQRLKRVFAIDIEKCVVAQFESSHRLKIQMLFPMRRTVQILKHLGLDRPSDPRNRSLPKDLTDQQTTLF